jgi:hypothetical protein
MKDEGGKVRTTDQTPKLALHFSGFLILHPSAFILS